MRISYIVQKGITKEKCDDIVLIGDRIHTISEGSYIIESFTRICIGDGVGGNSGGDIASKFVMEKVSDIGLVNDIADLKDKLLGINEALLLYAKEYAGFETMATTFTGLFSVRNNRVLGHCGNTRIYVLQGRFLKQITVDQTVYQWLVDTGNEEAAEYCNRNEIRSAFGGGDNKYINSLVVREVFEKGWPSLVLLTSDGIHDELDIDLIEEIVGNRNYSGLDRVTQLVGEAVKRGSKDDCTAILIET